jgi:hypothetical protein
MCLWVCIGSCGHAPVNVFVCTQRLRNTTQHSNITCKYGYSLADDQDHSSYGSWIYNCGHMADGLHKDMNREFGLCPCDMASLLCVHNQVIQPPLPLDICIAQDQHNSADPLCAHNVMFWVQETCRLHSSQNIIFCTYAVVHNSLVSYTESKLWQQCIRVPQEWAISGNTWGISWMFTSAESPKYLHLCFNTTLVLEKSCVAEKL